MSIAISFDTSFDTMANSLTPMLSQYMEIKNKYADCIIFYRMGDFYEMFFEDAKTAAPILGVQLTSRDKNATEKVPMCGVPHHSALQYIQKLLIKGFKVAICEQMEEPSPSKKLVKREVIRVLTPALIGDPELVSEENSNVLAALFFNDENLVELCLFDLLSLKVSIEVNLNEQTLKDILLRVQPKEFLLTRENSGLTLFKNILKFFPLAVTTLRDEYFINSIPPITYNALKEYLKETQKIEDISFLGEPEPIISSEFLSIDSVAVSSLEILKGNSPNAPCLFSTLDFTSTSMGKRRLKEWLTYPLRDKIRITERLAAVRNLIYDQNLLNNLKLIFSNIRDLERLTTKTTLSLSGPRDLLAIKNIVSILPELKSLLAKSVSSLLQFYSRELNILPELYNLLHEALLNELPHSYKEGRIFRDEFNEDIKNLRALSKDAKSMIAAIEMRERERTGIASLKIKFNKVFGYAIEITKTHANKIPRDYLRKQTLINAERYITQELQNFEEKILSSEQRLRTLEENLFLKLREEVGKFSSVLLKNALLISEVDVLMSFATAAKRYSYVEPVISDSNVLQIIDGRHPVLDAIFVQGKFVPNSVHMSDDTERTIIITGPNMAGKSTFMRQVALIVIMAQAGSFVPAKVAQIPCFDAIFTRIGSSDDLSMGRSTFMVEMSEVAKILKYATKNSLIIIDEIGRGTSTYDGLSLAWALLEYIHKEVRAKTLFATHFHEITAIEKFLSGVSNQNVLVKFWKNEIVFLHKISPGICNRSYGVEVAKLASLPDEVINRAKELLGWLESRAKKLDQSKSVLMLNEKQMHLF